MALLNFIYNRPNRVLALQKQYQADPRPIYLRPAGAKPTISTISSSCSFDQRSTHWFGSGLWCALQPWDGVHRVRNRVSRHWIRKTEVITSS
ncbi:hypothetical protein B0H12DRAFT_1100731 [Mycena haematopus]|nr:hypothetical protein B0H12DRAFT_1100731 [Mycena haematopus]